MQEEILVQCLRALIAVFWKRFTCLAALAFAASSAVWWSGSGTGLARAPTMRCMVRYRRIQPHPWLGAAMVWLFAPQLGAWKMDQIYGCLEIYCLKTDSLCQHHNLSKEYLLMLKSEARKKSCNFNNHHSCIGPTIFLEDFEISENRALIANFRKKATES